MIKKLNIDELEPGMYVCALERDNSSDVLSFMNNILVGSEDDIERFKKAGYKAAHVDLPDEEPEQAPSDSAAGSGVDGPEYGEVEILDNSPGAQDTDVGPTGGGGGYGGLDSTGSAAPDIFSGPAEPAGDEAGDKKEIGLYEVDLGNAGFIDDMATEDEGGPGDILEAPEGLELDGTTEFDLSGGEDDFAPPGFIEEPDPAPDRTFTEDALEAGQAEGPCGLSDEIPVGERPAEGSGEAAGRETEGCDDKAIVEAIEALGEEALDPPDTVVDEAPGPEDTEAIEPFEPVEETVEPEPDDRDDGFMAEALPADDEAALEEAPLLDPEEGGTEGESLFTGNDFVGRDATEITEDVNDAPGEAGDRLVEEGLAGSGPREGEGSGAEGLRPLEGTDFLENPVVEAGDDNDGQGGVGVPGPAGSAESDYREQFRDYKEELDDAKRIRNEAEGLVREFLSNVKEGEGIKADKVHSTVENMVDSIFRNQDALTSLARLKSFDDYTFAHCVNVCTLTVTLGRHMGLGRERLHELGVGSILHDVGKMLVPEDILNKPGKLTDEEFKVMRDHTVMGAELLDKTRGISAEARDVACHHHELFDGRGYPLGLAGEDITEFARITTVADVYDAMTSNRVYQKGMKSDEALKKMYMWRGERFEPQLVERLIRCLGIYPIGTLVEINTGEIAVVRLPDHTNPLKPLVMMIYDKDGKPYPKPFASALGDDEDRWITGSRNPEEFGAALQDLTACV